MVVVDSNGYNRATDMVIGMLLQLAKDIRILLQGIRKFSSTLNGVLFYFERKLTQNFHY